jgi:hypothetical protein
MMQLSHGCKLKGEGLGLHRLSMHDGLFGPTTYAIGPLPPWQFVRRLHSSFEIRRNRWGMPFAATKEGPWRP